MRFFSSSLASSISPALTSDAFAIDGPVTEYRKVALSMTTFIALAYSGRIAPATINRPMATPA